MIKIFKWGKWKAWTCRNCGCEFAFEESDVYHHEDKDHVICPQCQEIIIVKNHEKGGLENE